MTINITKKQLTIAAAIVAAIIIAIVGVSMIKNASYMKHAKHCQKDIHQLEYMSALLSSELHDAWSEYIFDDKEYIDKNTGKFYKRHWDMPTGADYEYCSNFSEAVNEKSKYYSGKGIQSTLDSLYSNIKTEISKMTPPPSKYSSVHPDIINLFHTAEGMYNCAIDPSGNLTSYTTSINSLSADFKKYESQVDILIGELDEEYKDDIEFDSLMKFL